MLEFVQKYIALFGGDPARVTAFGESAVRVLLSRFTAQAETTSPQGAFSIAILAARRRAPSAPTLFHRAILQSGFPSTMAFRDPGYSLWDKLLSTFSLSSLPTAAERVAGLRALPAEDLLSFVKSNGAIGGWGGTIEKGGLWETQPEATFQAGNWDRGVKSWVLGCNRDEGTLFAKVIPGAVRILLYSTPVRLLSTNPMSSWRLQRDSKASSAAFQGPPRLSSVGCTPTRPPLRKTTSARPPP